MEDDKVGRNGHGGSNGEAQFKCSFCFRDFTAPPEGVVRCGFQIFCCQECSDAHFGRGRSGNPEFFRGIILDARRQRRR